MAFLHMFLSALIMIFLISILILVHEIGHFLAAKFVGIRVDKFGFGLPIGPTLFKKKIGETEIMIHAFLLGGYVSFPDDEEDCNLEKDSPLRFCNKTISQRALVISMGVIFNVILAYFIIFMTGFIWKHLPDNRYIVTFERFAPTAVESIKNSGIKQGDIIYSVNGLEVKYPLTLNKFLDLSKEFDGYVNENTVQKKLSELKKLNPQINENELVKPKTVIKLPEFTDEESIKLTFDNVIGLEKYKSGEIILDETQKSLRDKINLKSEYKVEEDVTLNDIAKAISDTKKPINIVVLRNNEKIALKTVYASKEGKLGIEQKYVEQYKETKTIKQLVPAVFHYVNYNIGLMFYSLGKLFTGKVPVSEMNGIIAITKIGAEVIAYKGLFDGLLLTAIISLNLAILNILPIPALDGGHLLFLVIEKVTGKPVKKEFVEKVSAFFFYLLIILMVLIIYNDIHSWVIGKI